MLRRVAKKAADNGYVTIADPQYKFEVTLTDKGKEVVQKRMAAEDRAADAILEGLSEQEREQLASITAKISQTCEELGIDYSAIKERKHSCKKHGNHGGQGKVGHSGCEGGGHGCHKCSGHGNGGCRKHGEHGLGGHGRCYHEGSAPQYVFVFGEGGHHHHHCK